MNSVYVDIVISSDDFERLYGGTVTDVVCHSRDGRRIRFPGNILRRFVTREGIRGSFRIEFDADMRFVQIEKCP